MDQIGSLAYYSVTAGVREEGFLLGTPLRQIRLRKVADSRDKTYALLSFVPDIKLEPDYSLSVEHIYYTLAKEVMIFDRHVDLLSDSHGVHSSNGILTWIPD